MDNSVIIKGNKYGIIAVLDNNISFADLKEAFAKKFESSSKFFKNADMAITFEGRRISPEEERILLDIIAEKTDLNIICVVDNDEFHEKKFEKSINQKLEEISSATGQFYKGTLRSGQMLESESSIIILGDVNPGANVISKGNVIVLGSLKGNIYAGAGGNEDAFVVALEMAPLQIRIGDIIARSNDTKNKPKALSNDTMIAFVEDKNIYIEKLDKDILGDIRL